MTFLSLELIKFYSFIYAEDVQCTKQYIFDLHEFRLMIYKLI